MEHLKSILKDIYEDEKNIKKLKELKEDDLVLFGAVYDSFVINSVIDVGFFGIISKDLLKRIVFETLYTAFDVNYSKDKIPSMLSDFVYNFLVLPYYINETKLLFRTFINTQLQNMYKTNIYTISHNLFHIMPVENDVAVKVNLFNLIDLSLSDDKFSIQTTKPATEEDLFNTFKTEKYDFFKRFSFANNTLVINTDDIITNAQENKQIENELLFLILKVFSDEYNKI